MPSINEIESAAQRAHVGLTPNARLLIKLVLDSVTEDPHRSWISKSGDRVTREELIQDERQLTNSLPEILFAISRPLRINNLSTFDVLHWLTENLGSICPMRKLPNE